MTKDESYEKKGKISFLINHILLGILIYLIIAMPKQRVTVQTFGALLVGIVLIELVYLYQFFWKKDKRESQGDLMIFIWGIFIAWECCTSIYNIAHPVLIPAPEHVFQTFQKQWDKMLLNVVYSMELLFTGFFVGQILAVVFGLFAGWIPRLRNFFYPIASVMAPIPAVVFSPYLVSLMPSFRSASIMVIILGVFWPTFLTTVNRVTSMKPELLDSARMLCPGTFTMIGKILLPYVFPGVISGLKVSMITSLLMLNFAELMGATHGMGYYVQNSITYANYSHAVAGIIEIGIVVTILNRVVERIQKRLIRWS